MGRSGTCGNSLAQTIDVKLDRYKVIRMDQIEFQYPKTAIGYSLLAGGIDGDGLDLSA